MKKNIETILMAVLIAFWLWLGVSWADVIMHNGIPGYAYSDTNFFSLITSTEEKEVT